MLICSRSLLRTTTIALYHVDSRSRRRTMATTHLGWLGRPMCWEHENLQHHWPASQFCGQHNLDLLADALLWITCYDYIQWRVVFRALCQEYVVKKLIPLSHASYSKLARQICCPQPQRQELYLFHSCPKEGLYNLSFPLCSSSPAFLSFGKFMAVSAS